MRASCCNRPTCRLRRFVWRADSSRPRTFRGRIARASARAREATGSLAWIRVEALKRNCPVYRNSELADRGFTLDTLTPRLSTSAADKQVCSVAKTISGGSYHEIPDRSRGYRRPHLRAARRFCSIESAGYARSSACRTGSAGKGRL
ncbi:protein of unknown function [Paraburkholderia dioscoreae]|uniref:Uncharacterized protein n=1 Tax=Paraburkholderia dioscoreae TaxID=2604047 RepID=A0A5Q4YYE2_9BURK|nr:protein of unknown function [Paraburkholderia dioscoreae]